MYTTRIVRKHNALIFDGIRNYVEVPDGPSLDITDEITFLAWIYLNARDIDQKISTKAFAYLWGIFTNNKLEATIYSGGTAYWQIRNVAGGTVLTTGKWYYVGFTFDGRYIRTYVNSILDRTFDTGATRKIDVTTYPLRIGRYYTPSLWFNGFIDEIRIYNRALTATEINKLYKGQNIANGLVLYLDFNELGGNKCLDLSKYKNDGTIHEARRSILRTGGLSFDGIDDNVEVADSPSLNFDAPISVTFWAYPNIKKDLYETIGKFASDWSTFYDGWRVGLMKDGRISFNFSDGSYPPVLLFTTGRVKLNEWNFIGVTYDKTKVRFYIDGTLDREVAETRAIKPSTKNLYICAPYASQQALFDEVRVYNRALSQEEIRSLYRGKSITKGLVLYFPMNEYSGNKVYDNSGFENHGVIHT